MAYDGSLIFDTKIDLKGYESGLKKIEASADSAGKAFEPFSKAAAGLLTTMVATTKLTEEYRTEMGKLETAFTTSGHSAESAKQTYTDLFGVLGETDQAVEAAGHLAKLTTNQAELSEWTTIATGVFATFGDSLPIENLTESANETAKTGLVVGGLADALNWAGISEDAFAEKLAGVSTEQERQKLITETLSGIYSEAAGKYREVNEELIRANEIQAEVNDAMARFGEVMQPIINDIMEWFADALSVLSEWFAKLDEDTIKFMIGILGVVAVVTPLLLLIGNLAGGLADIIRLVGLLTAKMAISTGATVAATGATTAAGAAAAGASVGVGLLGTAINFLFNPVTLIIAAIALLVVGIVGLWKTSEEFRDFWIAVWEKIKAAPKKAIDDIKADLAQWKDIGAKIVNGIFDGIKAGWQAIENWVNDKFGWLDNLVSEFSGGGGTKAQDSRGRVSGSYAAGLSSVGSDMIATVHRGEKIVPANQSNADTALLQQVVSELRTLQRTVHNQPYVERNILRVEGVR